MEKAWSAFPTVTAIVILAGQVSNSAALPTSEVTIPNVTTCQSVQGTWVDPLCIIDQIPLTISSGQKLTIASNVQLLLQKAMSNAGTVDNHGGITNSQSIINSGTFNNFGTVGNSKPFDNPVRSITIVYLSILIYSPILTQLTITVTFTIPTPLIIPLG